MNSENNNIVNIIMSKTIKYNLSYLKGLANNVKNEEDQIKVKQIIGLYAERKIAQKTTAEKIILGYTNADTSRKKKSIEKKYDKVIDKYNDLKPLGERMTDNKVLLEVQQGDKNKAKTEIVFLIREQKNIVEGKKEFLKNFNSIYKRIEKEITPVMDFKKSTKIQMTVNYDIKKTKFALTTYSILRRFTK